MTGVHRSQPSRIRVFLALAAIGALAYAWFFIVKPIVCFLEPWCGQ